MILISWRRILALALRVVALPDSVVGVRRLRVRLRLTKHERLEFGAPKGQTMSLCQMPTTSTAFGKMNVAQMTRTWMISLRMTWTRSRVWARRSARNSVGKGGALKKSGGRPWALAPNSRESTLVPGTRFSKCSETVRTTIGHLMTRIWRSMSSRPSRRCPTRM